MIFFVVMSLSVYNADTGDMLYSTKGIMGQREIDLKDCLASGVILAKSAAEHWRLTFPNSFAQVNCKWETDGITR